MKASERLEQTYMAAICISELTVFVSKMLSLGRASHVFLQVITNKDFCHFHVILIFQQIALIYFYAQKMSLVSILVIVLLLGRATMIKAILLTG